MRKEDLYKCVGQHVKIHFYDGDIMEGVLQYVPEYSIKYKYKKPGLYYIDNLGFKCTHVKYLQVLGGGKDAIG